MNIIAKNLRGGGKTLTYLLAGAIALFVGSTWAATHYQIGGTKNGACAIALDGLASDVEITSTPKLAFPGITLDDIPERATFYTSLYGEDISADYSKLAVGIHEKRHKSDGSIDKIAIQCEIYERPYRRGVILVLTNGEGGVYVEMFGRFFKENGLVENYHYEMNGDGVISFRWLSDNEKFSGSWVPGKGNACQAAGLRVHGVSPVYEVEASTLAFPGVTLADITNCVFVSGFRYGKWAQTPAVNSIANYSAVWLEEGEPQKIALQFTHSIDTEKAAIIELVNGEGGVFARQVFGLNGASGKGFAFDGSGKVIRTSGIKYTDNTYGVQDLYALPPSVKSESEPVKIWSGVTLADIDHGRFTARFSGADGVSEGSIFAEDSAIGYNKKQRYNDEGNLTNLVVEFQTQYGGNVRCVVVSFTDDGNDVYATGLAARYTSGTVGNCEFYTQDGKFKGTYVALATTQTGDYYGVCDLRVKMPKTFTLDRDMSWSDLRNSATLNGDSLVRIIVAGDSPTLTINEDVNVAQIEFVNGSGAKLVVAENMTLSVKSIVGVGSVEVQEGATVYVDSISGVNSILNNGTFVKTGDGTLTFPFNKGSAANGITTVSCGTLVASEKGSGNNCHKVYVKSGATFDIHGSSVSFDVTLEDGACFVNDGNAIPSNYQQVNKITLVGDATVIASKSFGMLAPSYNETCIDLGENTLSVKGSSQFWLVNTTINGEGTVAVEENGFLYVTTKDVKGDKCTVRIGSKGQLAVGAKMTVRNFINANAERIWGNGTLKVTGLFTLGETKIETSMELGDGATIKVTGTTPQEVSSAFSASGTIKVDTSEIPADKFASAENGENVLIPVLTIPQNSYDSCKEAFWQISGIDASMRSLRWRQNGNNMTLYVVRPGGTKIIIR